MENLYDKLTAYGKSEAYPFHMPGHKRQIRDFGDPFAIDITEIDDFDNLHHAEGIIKAAQERAARIYGAKKTFFLVNGSTGGILSAISACVRHGGEILMARNCHKAAYHACYLGQLRMHYLYPQTEGTMGINGVILPEDVENSLREHPEIQAVMITSPTYDGIVSDVRKIAEIAHRYGVPLIVDEAHGAHFGFHPYFPESSVKLGADVVIHSLHKTLPSLTQTALLHVCGELADEERVQRFLGIYQTSSPSYVFMASMDNCMEFLENGGKEAFDGFAALLENFYRKAGKFSYIKVPDYERDKKCDIIKNAYDFDRSKILLALKGAEGGQWLYQKLRTEYDLQLEMAQGGYALALTSVMDTPKGMERLIKALESIDRELEKADTGEVQTGVDVVTQNEAVFSLGDAYDMPKETVLLMESAGRISGEFLYLYPPGIPLLVPGERIGEELLKRVEFYQRKGLSLQGLKDHQAEKIMVIEEVAACQDFRTSSDMNRSSII